MIDGIGSLLGASLQRVYANQAAKAHLDMEYLRGAMNQRAYELWQIHGDAYAGIDDHGNAILWRETTIPKTGKRG